MQMNLFQENDNLLQMRLLHHDQQLCKKYLEFVIMTGILQDPLQGPLLPNLNSNPSEFPVLSYTGNETAYNYLYEMRDAILASDEVRYRDEFEWNLSRAGLRQICNPGQNSSASANSGVNTLSIEIVDPLRRFC